ncbi:hypothetical protein C7271_19850 [filamentous cyanobacterium CCP5]|nr:hypothetical protein C7271_19850 [filamentous cyanobacterium CCP5]
MAFSSTHKFPPKLSSWYGAVLLALSFWISSSLLLDCLIMPGMYVSGMMEQPEFGTAGYLLFWLFNRVEVVCGAVVLTGLLILRYYRSASGIVTSAIRSRWALGLGLGLLAIALIYTYLLTPTMGSLGITLDLFEEAAIPATMNQLHSAYWGLELLKLAGGALLLQFGYRDLVRVTAE